jgi:hypothetical protein
MTEELLPLVFIIPMLYLADSERSNLKEETAREQNEEIINKETSIRKGNIYI